ncbi:unnamed protein product [Cuscuta campestris]|uniref:Uncharacterized protein n=1 Tax=Cuscuta campestris TaxID=132261 RepID=A0A484MMR1_9ASTE|nr:unnamed protein product [Cuscuta campestris]
MAVTGQTSGDNPSTRTTGAELRPTSNNLSSGEVETNKFFSGKSVTRHRSIQQRVPAATSVTDHSGPSTNFAGDPPVQRPLFRRRRVSSGRPSVLANNFQSWCFSGE